MSGYYHLPSQEFIDNVVIPYAKETDDAEAHNAVHHWIQGTFDKREFWHIRKKIANWKHQKWLEYVTSPESETYWSS